MELFAIINDLHKRGDHSIKLNANGSIEAIHGRATKRVYKVQHGTLVLVK